MAPLGIPMNLSGAEFQKWKEGCLRSVIRHPRAPAIALRVAVLLSMYVNKASRQAWPSQRTIAEDLGASRISVRRGLDWLAVNGFLTVTKEPGARRGTIKHVYSPKQKHMRAQGGPYAGPRVGPPGGPKPSNEPSMEPHIQSAPHSARVVPTTGNASYPRRVKGSFDEGLESLAEDMLGAFGKPKTVAGIAAFCREHGEEASAADIRKMIHASDKFIIGERDYVFLREWEDAA